jgi:hypothetical protein
MIMRPKLLAIFIGGKETPDHNRELGMVLARLPVMKFDTVDAIRGLV